MSTWGANSTTSNTSPTWYTNIKNISQRLANTRPFHPADDQRLSATPMGWIRQLNYTDAQGKARVKQEVVVADRGMAQTINDLNVVGARWGNVASQAYVGIGNTYTFDVIFNMPVCFATAPGWTVFTSNNSAGGGTTAAATYVSGNGTNTLTFRATANGTVNNTAQIPTAILTTAALEAYDPSRGRAASPTITLATGAVEGTNGRIFAANSTGIGAKNTTTQLVGTVS